MAEPHLSIRVRASQDLLRDGVMVGIIFRRWGGSPEQELVASAPVADEVDLEVTAPRPDVRSALPPALGGPWGFAIGYGVAYENAADADDGRRVLAVAPALRVLWTEGAFPVEAFAQAARDPAIDAVEWQRLIEGLAGLRAGLSIVRSTLMRRSLAGFVAAPDEVVALEPGRSLAWPPATF